MAGFKKSAKHGKGHHAEPRPAAKLSKQKAAVADSYRLRDYGDLDEIERAYVDGLAGMIKAESRKNGGLVDYLAKAWHANQIHGDHLDPYTEPLDRLTKEPGTSASAVFVKTPETPDPMRTAIRRAVEDNVEKIAIWMLYGKSSDLELNFVERPERPLDTKIGTGVARIPRGKSGKYNFVERDCYDAKVVLIKTSEGASGYSVWGPAPTLRLKTAHPDAAAPSGKKNRQGPCPYPHRP